MSAAHQRQIPIFFILLLLPGLLITAGCAGNQPQAAGDRGDVLALPPIVDPPTARRHPGKFVWHDLLTPDTVAARTFYGELLGWSFRERGEYIEIYNGDRRIGGMLPIRPRQRKRVDAQWLAAMSVSDVEAASTRVTRLGGRIINGPMSLGERGMALLIADPEGGQLLLLHSAAGDPEDRQPGYGDWLWNEAWSRNADALAGFYKPVGRYEATERGKDYVVLINEGHWRAGIRTIEDPVWAGRWVPAVRVSDPNALLEKVEALGGVVWVRPGEKANGKGTALISDNNGALLILQKWDFANQEEEK